jgi:hypothetical protein
VGCRLRQKRRKTEKKERSREREAVLFGGEKREK